MTNKRVGRAGETRKIGAAPSCEAKGVPAGPINDLGEVFADPKVVHPWLAASLDGVPTVRPPFRCSGAETALDRPSPRLDEHGPEIRGELDRGRSRRR